jgi:hypothetical protein
MVSPFLKGEYYRCGNGERNAGVVTFNVWRRFPQDFLMAEILADDVALYSPILWQPIDRATG